MTKNSCLRLYLGAGLAVAALFTASPALAQYAPPAIGTDINLKNDLGLTDDNFPMFKVVLKLRAKHKIRLQYLPASYSQTAAPTRTLTFAGKTFVRNIRVNSTRDWKVYQIGYEYDFISSNFMTGSMTLKGGAFRTRLSADAGRHEFREPAISFL